MWGRVVIVAFAGALLAGCEADFVLNLIVDGDGSGRVGLQVAADEELVAELEAAASDLEGLDADAVDPLDALAAELDDLTGWDAEVERADGGRRVTATTRVAEAAGFVEATTALSEGLASPGVSLLGPIAVSVDEERVRVDGHAEYRLGPEALLVDVDGDEADAAVHAAASELLETLDVRVTVELPAPPEDANAHDTQGRELTWHVPPGEVAQVQAVGPRAGLPVWTPWVAAGAAALVALGGLAGWLVRRG